MISKFRFFLLVFCFLFFSQCIVMASESNDKDCSLKNHKGFEITKVDCIFSIGESCRPAYHLAKYGFRFQSSPLDWMKDYSLDAVNHFFETSFNDFFENIEVVPNEFHGGCRTVSDVKNKITSIHHFKRDFPLEDEHVKVRNMAKTRGKKVCDILRNADSVGFICNRKNDSTKNFVNFLKRFSETFPNKKVTLINIVDSKIEDIKQSVLFDKDNLKIIQFSFNDKFFAWKDKSLPRFIGNHHLWGKVMSTIKLTDKLIGKFSGFLFHAMKVSDWQEFRRSKVLETGEDGFIHCSTFNQLENAIRENPKRFDDQTIILCIDPKKLKSAKVKWERTKKNKIIFPHIYGDVDSSSIVCAEKLVKSQDGKFKVPDKLKKYI